MFNKVTKEHIIAFFTSYPFFLACISLVVFFTNYIPGTFLTGWDNLHPEFNFWLNFKRNISGVWQEYRGLGLYDGQAHIANLFDTLLVWVLHFFLPQSMLRYVVVTLMHYIGGLGMYYLALHLTSNKKASFLAALFYMFNLGAVQQFITPLESFVFHFAFLPWIFLLAIEYIQNRRLKTLGIFFIVAIISTPVSFIPTIFLTFSLSFMSIALYDFFHHKHVWHFFILGLFMFAANAFWFMPYVQGVPENAPTIEKSRINQFSSEENFLRNQTRGSIGDVISLKGFMMDIEEYNPIERHHFRLMQAWEDYTHTLPYIVGYIFLFFTIVLGVIVAVKQNKAVNWPFFVSGGIAFFFLTNNTPVIRELQEWIRMMFPIFAEALRNPFTKFTTIFFFTMSLFFAYGMKYMMEKYPHKKISTVAAYIAILFIAIPVLGGQFYSPLLKQPIPKEYFSLFSYMQKQPHDARVATLPMENFWSWQAWDWGYIGSGMTWFAIPQPMMVRAFDPWSTYNEQFYNEMAQAIRTGNTSTFQDVIKKYNITYLILDEHRIDSVSQQKINYTQLQAFLRKVPTIEKETSFGKLIVYKNVEEPSRIFTLNVKETAKVGSQIYLAHNDQTYADIGDYVVNADKPDFIYPFVSLFTERSQEDLQFTVQKEGDKFILTSPKLPTFDSALYQLEVPNMITSEKIIPIGLQKSGNEFSAKAQYPEIAGINKKTILMSSPVLTSVTVPFASAEAVVVDSPKQTARIGSPIYVNTNDITDIEIQSDEDSSVHMPLDLRALSVASPESQLVPVEGTIEQIRLGFTVPANTLAYTNFNKKNNNIVVHKLHPNDEDGITSFTSEAVEKGTDDIFLTARKNEIELVTYQANLPHKTAYIGFPEVEHISGLPITFFIDNPEKKRVELETKLSKDTKDNIIVLPEGADNDDGYAFHFILKSVGTEIASSKISNFMFAPLPYNFVTKMRFVRKDTAVTKKNDSRQIVSYNELRPSKYVLEARSNQDTYVVLDQAFHSGWKAYTVPSKGAWATVFPSVTGKKLENHVLINNWENGWYLPATGDKNQVIVITFEPQIWQYFGFLIMIGFGAGLVAYRFDKLPWKRKSTPLPKHLHKH